jgi:hypothetical protein
LTALKRRLLKNTVNSILSYSNAIKVKKRYEAQKQAKDIPMEPLF